MLIVNGVRPNSIVANGQDVHIVQMKMRNDEMVYLWGKEVFFNIIQPEGGTIVAKRILSPFENAELKELTESDSVYWNDGIELTISLQENYNFETFTLNGQKFSDLGFEQDPLRFSCSDYNEIGAILVKEETQPTWHTIFQGSITSFQHQETTPKTYYMNFPGLKVGVPTLLTGELRKYPNQLISQLNQKQVPATLYYQDKIQKIEIADENYLQLTLQRPTPTFLYGAPYFVITKIEQYY